MAKFFININGELNEIGKGNSAYDIAVYNGFEGTEQEWLNSIRGTKLEIDENKHWIIDDVDSGIIAEGNTPYINDDGYWEINKVNTGIKAYGVDGEDGVTYTPSIGQVETVDSSLSANVTVELNEIDKTASYNFSIPKGEDGITYTPRIKTVNTVDSIYSASASLDIDDSDKTANFVLNLPKGKNGNYVPENNVGAHNSIYRGMYLGDTVTDEQYSSINAGTFEDLYIGDYWTIEGINYRIAAFDYYLNCGDTNCTTHHAVIVPDTNLYTYVMNDTGTTVNGYVGSKMYTEGLESAKTTIKNTFSGHVLKHRIYLTNAVANGRPSAGAWCDSEVDLMCEEMVYGTGIFRPTSDGTNVPSNYRVEKSQLPLFAHEPSRICNRATWWLRDVVTASFFAGVYGSGRADYIHASYSNGVRPAFCIS